MMKLFAVASLTLIFGFANSAAQAATINVTSTLDDGVGCTLRNALESSFSNGSFGGCTAGSGDDIIDLSAISGSTIVLSQDPGFGELQIADQTMSELIIEGAGVTIDGGSASRIFTVQTDAILNDLKLTGGSSSEDAGAIAVDGTLEINNSSVFGNSATLGGGAIAVSGTLVVRNSTLNDNSTASFGGAIRGFPGSVTQLINSTLSGNTADLCGGVFVGGGAIEVIQTTIVENGANEGGALRSQNATVTLTNSILANSVGASDCDQGLTTLTLVGVNLIEDQGTCGLAPSDSLLEEDPLLSALSNIGGPTETHVPMTGSPVIDAGSDADVPVDLIYDQRGPNFLRIGGVQVDLGSFEVQDPEQTGPDFVVNIAEDVDDGLCRAAPGKCSLREALASANANVNISTITFDSSLLTPVSTITLSGTALPVINTQVIIEAAGITVDGDNSSRIFDVDVTGELTLNQISLVKGFDSLFGGAMNVTGEVVITNSTLSNNSAGGGTGFGGAVYVSGGMAQLLNSTLHGNSATTSGGGIYSTNGTVELNQVTLSANSATFGAGLNSLDSSFTLSNSLIADNIGSPDCQRSGGTFTLLGVNLVENQGDCGLPSGDDLIEGNDPLLGGLSDNGGLTPTQLPAIESPARNAGDNKQVTESFDQRGSGFMRIFGPKVDLGAVEVQANPQTGPDFVVNVADDLSDGSCDIAPDDCSLRDALIAANAQADISTISFDASLLAPAATVTLGGTALPAITTEIVIEAAGITIDGDGASRMFEVSGSGNLTLRQINLINGFDADFGGAIDVGGELTILDSTLANNNSGFGGAIQVASGSVEIINSTIFGNSATVSGGAIFANGSSVDFVQTTVSDNSAPNGAGFFNSGSDVGLLNSIIANSTGSPDCQSSGGNILLTGKNLIEDQGACGIPASSDLIEGTDPLLGTLADNGGPTLTVRPQNGSPVIDGGDASVVPAEIEFDQRGPGFPRVIDNSVDLGSVEESKILFKDRFEGSP